MKNLILNEQETESLERCGAVEIERNGFAVVVEDNPDYDPDDALRYDRYKITAIAPYTRVIKHSSIRK